jgi:hypothetical protein
VSETLLHLMLVLWKNRSTWRENCSMEIIEGYLKGMHTGVDAQNMLSRIDDGSDCGARLRWIPRLKRGKQGQCGLDRCN